MGERVALTSYASEWDCYLTRSRYADSIAALPAQLVDTRKTTPGLRLLESYSLGGAINHRMGLDDAVMIRTTTLPQLVVSARRSLIRHHMPYP